MQLFERISTRYAIGIGTLFFLLVVFALSFSSILVSKRLNSLKHELVRDYAELHSSTIVHSLKSNSNYLSNRLFNPLYEYDITTLNEEISDIREWLEPESIVILDATGKVVTDGSLENPLFGQQQVLPDIVEDNDNLLLETADSRILYFRIGYGDISSGYARIKLARDEDRRIVQSLQQRVESAWQEYTRDFRLIAIALLLMFFISIIGAIWWLSMLLSKPINRMILAAEKYAAGELDYELRANSKDEFGRLGRSLNTMATNLRESNYLLLQAEEISSLGSWEWVIAENHLLVSNGICSLFSIQSKNFNNSIDDLMPCISRADQQRFRDTISGSSGDKFRQEFNITSYLGIDRVIRVKGEVFRENPGDAIVRGTMQDVTEQQESEMRLKQLANYDRLTGLPNRNLFYDRLNHALNKARRNSSDVALLFIDLDRFKSINDALGHATGDLLLREASSRMLSAVRDCDTLARMGGDEFTIVLEDISDSSSPQKVASHVLEVLSSPFHIHNRELNVSASIGIAIYPADSTDLDTLIKNADTAMYVAKERGKNQFHFFTHHLEELARDKLDLEQQLRDAIRNSKFEFHYQPQINLDNNRCVAAEALLRWQIDGEYKSPAEFIPVLEDSGLINSMTDWAIEQVCKMSHLLQESGLVDFRLSLNLSASQFQQSDLIAILDRHLDSNNIPATSIEIEITESTLLDARLSRYNASELQRRNIRLAIDDFGTGYSSLSYLRQYDVDALKIDQSFVQNIEHDLEDLEISAAIISLARAFNIDCVAEGVETHGQRTLLAERGCNIIQGYLISKPLPQATFIEWCKQTCTD